MWQLVLSLMFVSAGAVDDCVCVCVEGQEQTLCSNAARAAELPNRCVGELACLVPSGEAFVPEVLTLPHDGAQNCRTARVWQFDYSKHRIKRICDTMTE